MRGRAGRSHCANRRSQRRPNAACEDRRGLHLYRRGQRPDRAWKHARDLHGDGGRWCSSVHEGKRKGLGDRGVRHAPPCDRTAHTARSGARQTVRTNARDPTTHRPVVARRDEAGSARRADRMARLRRHPGRRRHAHSLNHRRIRGTSAGLRTAGRRGNLEDSAADRYGSRHKRRDRGRPSAS